MFKFQWLFSILIVKFCIIAVSLNASVVSTPMPGGREEKYRTSEVNMVKKRLKSQG